VNLGGKQKYLKEEIEEWNWGRYKVYNSGSWKINAIRERMKTQLDCMDLCRVFVIRSSLILVAGADICLTI
jgi:adenylate cyclase